MASIRRKYLATALVVIAVIVSVGIYSASSDGYLIQKQPEHEDGKITFGVHISAGLFKPGHHLTGWFGLPTWDNLWMQYTGWIPVREQSVNGVEGVYYKAGKHGSVVTNVGVNFTFHKLLNVNSNNTSTNFQFAYWLALSNSTAGDDYTVTSCPATEITDVSGLERATGTVQIGTIASGDGNANVTHSFTSAGSTRTIGMICVFTNDVGGAGEILFAEGTPTQAIVAIGDIYTANMSLTISN